MTELSHDLYRSQLQRNPALRVLAALMGGLNRIARDWNSWRSARATRHALERLDDRMLKDIGLDRSEIAWQGRMPGREMPRWHR